MTFPSSLNATGYLLSPRRGQAGITLDTRRVEGLSEETLGVTGWFGLTYRSKEALVPVEVQSTVDYDYSYNLLLRRSNERLLLAADSAAVVDAWLKRTALDKFTTAPTIDIPHIVSDCANAPGPYVLSAVYARVDGFGHSLRSISLYGADLADAKLFRDVLPHIAPFRIGLRDARRREEVLTLGSRGEVGLYYGGPRTLKSMDAALKYLSTKEYLHWSQ